MEGQRTANPEGHRCLVDNAWLTGPAERVVPALRRAFTEQPTDLQPVTAGQYPGDSDFTVRQLRFMGEEQWVRLKEIRAVRDPKGAC